MKAPTGFPLRHLAPRECFVTRKPTLISTVLGSCVAVTMFDPVLLAGGMAHAFLPHASEYAGASGDPMPCKFADSAVAHLLEHFQRLGAPPGRLEVKLFGGGDAIGMGDNAARSPRNFSVGERNIQAALAACEALGLPVAARDVGGATGRKLLFLTETGGAWVKKLHKGVPGQRPTSGL